MYSANMNMRDKSLQFRNSNWTMSNAWNLGVWHISEECPIIYHVGNDKMNYDLYVHIIIFCFWMQSHKLFKIYTNLQSSQGKIVKKMVFQKIFHVLFVSKELSEIV